MLNRYELAEIHLSDALIALYDVRAGLDAGDLDVTKLGIDPRRLAVAITSGEQAALWFAAAIAREPLPDALRRRRLGL